ncbi:MAG TPA: phage holin family protein [Streptosporangiaceae bacterium]|jgi:uncharacterized membrane protein YqjE|nr:phage holin family protein [Streptosporangiaceae bacterium]
MAQTGTPRPAGSDQSLGDLVALAAKDVSQLIRCEMELARAELRGDARRAAQSSVLIGMGAFMGCLILVMLCFAYAYGLTRAGLYNWLSFIVVAFTLAVVATIAFLIARSRMRGVTGMRTTRATMRDSIAALRRDGDHPEITRPAQR